MAWPSPEAVQLKIYTGKNMLFLPVRKTRHEDTLLRHSDPPEAAPPLRVKVIKPEHHNWRVVRDLARDISTLEVVNDDGVQNINEIDLTVCRSAKEWYTYQGNDFNSVRGETLCERSFIRGTWSARTVLTSSEKEFFSLRNSTLTKEINGYSLIIGTPPYLATSPECRSASKE